MEEEKNSTLTNQGENPTPENNQSANPNAESQNQEIQNQNLEENSTTIEFNPFKEAKKEEEEKEPSKSNVEPEVLSELEQRVRNAEVRAEVSDFLADDKNKIFAPFKNEIVEIAKNPKFKDLKIEAIAWMVAGDKVLANSSKSGSSGAVEGSTTQSIKSNPNLPDFTKMSKEEFEEYRAKFRRNGR